MIETRGKRYSLVRKECQVPGGVSGWRVQWTTGIPWAVGQGAQCSSRGSRDWGQGHGVSRPVPEATEKILEFSLMGQEVMGRW